MTEAYDGRQVVGMDLHRRRSVIVRMTEDGRKLETVRITSSPAALRAVIPKAGKHPRVVIEATYGWYWAADVLETAGAEVHLAHPLGVTAYSCRRVTNDERDAADLAGLLRMGRLPEAWIAPPEIRELRELTRYRHKLVKARTSVKDQVHGVLAKLGIPVTYSDIFGVHGQAWLDELKLPQPYAGKVASLRQLAGRLQPVQRPPEPGTLGSVPQTLITALGPGSAAATASAIVAWLRYRTSDVVCRITREDGTPVELAAKRVRGIDTAAMAELVATLSRSLGDHENAPPPSSG